MKQKQRRQKYDVRQKEIECLIDEMEKCELDLIAENTSLKSQLAQMKNKLDRMENFFFGIYLVVKKFFCYISITL